MRCAWPWQCSPVAFERIFGKLIGRSTDFCTHTFSCLLHDALPRDMVEYKGRVESYSREVLRKESQIKELQGRIDTGDGCEYFPFKTFSSNFSLSPDLLATLLAKPPTFQRSLPCLRVGLDRQ